MVQDEAGEIGTCWNIQRFVDCVKDVGHYPNQIVYEYLSTLNG